MNRKSLQTECWLAEHDSAHYILAYGSLLNRDSRQRHSNMFSTGIATRVSGFERGWYTRAYHESQTYVGATPNHSGSLNAQLLPVDLNPSFQTREQDYRFVNVPCDALSFTDNVDDEKRLREALSHAELWICETLKILPADEAYPVSQSYIDTCLAGCLEHGGETEAQCFIDTTTHWEHPRKADRQAPVYPRFGKVDNDATTIIDRLLGMIG